MTKRRWKPRQPASMQEAIRLCLDYALHKHEAPELALFGEGDE